MNQYVAIANRHWRQLEWKRFVFHFSHHTTSVRSTFIFFGGTWIENSIWKISMKWKLRIFVKHWLAMKFAETYTKCRMRRLHKTYVLRAPSTVSEDDTCMQILLLQCSSSRPKVFVRLMFFSFVFQFVSFLLSRCDGVVHASNELCDGMSFLFRLHIQSQIAAFVLFLAHKASESSRRKANEAQVEYTKL